MLLLRTTVPAWVRVLVAVLLLTGPGGTAAHAAEAPRPVLNANFPDPAVVASPSGLVAYSTGERVPYAWSRDHRGRWQHGRSILARHPRWAAEGGIWAVDVVKVRDQWLLYYAVPVRGLGEHGRCIAVARARTARGPFHPAGRRPLVCPAYARTPQAQDPMLPRDRTLPRAGVIDPSVHVDATGSPHLLYKTDRIPSSIRILPLSGSGLKARAPSQELLRSNGVIENPVLISRPEGHVMLLSEGDWTKCSYRTTWRRSQSLLDWSLAESGVLLDRRSGLCGPGGADLVRTGSTVRMFLHGWTCHGTDRPCRGGAKWDHRRRARGVRAMYAARLRWEGGLPTIASWVSPR